MNKIIINKLLNNIDKTDMNKSSHWKNYLNKNSNFLNKYEKLGFGVYNKKSLKNIIHNQLNKIIFGNDVHQSNLYKKYKFYFDKINRYVDIDSIKHIFTFLKIKNFLDPKSICIIGDGQLNGFLGALITFPKAKIYSVNLSEVLINDYLIFESLELGKREPIELVDNVNFIQKNKYVLVPANYKNFLLNKNIDLFINIASFQEMNLNEVECYFEIIKNNKSKLYCCNREYKKLIGGEELIFDNYPFGDSKKIFYEDCEWYKQYYAFRPPYSSKPPFFIHNYNGNMKHCLVDFKKT